MKRSRAVSLAVVAIVIAVFLAWAFWPRPTPVDMAKVERGTILVTIDEEAEARVRDVFEVSAPFSGRLLRVEVDPGDPVTVGETVLARMRPILPDALDVRTEEQATAAVQAAEASLDLARAEKARAEADLALARSELKRLGGLLQFDAASRSDYDRAERNFGSAEAQLRSAEATIEIRTADLRRARALLMSITDAEKTEMTGNPHPVETTPVLAPTGGVVLQVHTESERTIAAGAPIVSIGDPQGDLEVVAELLSPEAVRVKRGDPVLIERWGGDHVLEGRVHRVEPWAFTKVSALGIEEQRVRVRIDIEDAEGSVHRLGHGYRVYVRIVTERRDDAVIVPTTSVFAHGDGDAVFAVRDGRTVLTPVVLGVTNGLQTQVLDDSLAARRVILYPGADLRDGDRVVPRVDAIE